MFVVKTIVIQMKGHRGDLSNECTNKKTTHFLKHACCVKVHQAFYRLPVVYKLL
jgi:hypothetical protein